MASSLLVIDDSQTIRTVVQMALQGAGHRVVASDTAEGGLLAARENPPDLVLLDYLLPDRTGDEVCRRLAADPRTARIPILVLSARGEQLRAQAASWPGVVGIMSKPFTSAALLARVTEVLGQGGDGDAWTFSEQNSVAQAMFQVLKPALREVPAWEVARAGAQASTFFAQRLLTPAAISGLMTTITPVMTGVLERRREEQAPALSGCLRRIPLSDVLRLIEGWGRAGRLEVVVEGQRSVIHLDHGRVVGIAAPIEQERAALREAFPTLAEALVAGALRRVVDEGLPTAVVLHADPSTLPLERLRAQLRISGERELDRLWEMHGTFAFHPGALPTAFAGLEVVIDPAQIALVRLRMVDDLAQIEAHAGRLAVVFERSPGAAGLLARQSLTDDERRVLALVDGIRDTEAVVRSVGLGLLPALRILFRFIRLGLIAEVERGRRNAPLLVIAAADELGEGRLGEALAHSWTASGRGPSQVVEAGRWAIPTHEGVRPVIVVVEVAVDVDPEAGARTLRQRLPPGVPLVALCAEEPPTISSWTSAFDGLLVPPLHLDDLARLLTE